MPDHPLHVGGDLPRENGPKLKAGSTPLLPSPRIHQRSKKQKRPPIAIGDAAEASTGMRYRKCTVQGLGESSAAVYFAEGPQLAFYPGRDEAPVERRTCVLQRPALRRLETTTSTSTTSTSAARATTRARCT